MKWHETPSDEIHASNFAEDRKRALASNLDQNTTFAEDLGHRLRHDYALGGICCGLKGDPFNWAQRATVMTSTMIVSLSVR